MNKIMDDKVGIVFLGLVLVSSISCSSTVRRVDITAPFSPNLIRKTLMNNIPRFRRCLANRVQLNHGHDLELIFTIKASGEVHNANVLSNNSTIRKEELTCIKDHLLTIRFPKSHGANDSSVEVRQPLNLFPR